LLGDLSQARGDKLGPAARAELGEAGAGLIRRWEKSLVHLVQHFQFGDELGTARGFLLRCWEADLAELGGALLGEAPDEDAGEALSPELGPRCRTGVALQPHLVRHLGKYSVQRLGPVLGKHWVRHKGLHLGGTVQR
jgi:hypothetical protein